MTKRIIELSKEDSNFLYLWSFEIEVSDAPFFLKKGKCSNCSIIFLDKEDKELITAEKIVKTNWEMKGKNSPYYRCASCAKKSVTFKDIELQNIKVNNPQDLEYIRKKINTYA